MNKLKQLEACGQSPWLDYLKRSLIEKGELRTLIERDGLKGVTSNPSIFEKAIGETDEYADALKQFQAQADHSISAIYEHLAIADIRAAADVLRPVYEQTQGPGRLHQPGMLALSGQRYRSHGGRGAAAVGGGGPAQPDGEGAGHPGRHSRDPPADRSRAQHQHHPALRRERLRAGGRSLYLRARRSEAGRRRSVQDRQRRQHLRQPHRCRDRQAAGQARRQRAGGSVARQGGDRQREGRLRSLQGAVLRPALAGAGRSRAQRRSACSGPPPAPRIRPTRTRCMSRR